MQTACAVNGYFISTLETTAAFTAISVVSINVLAVALALMLTCGKEVEQ